MKEAHMRQIGDRTLPLEVDVDAEPVREGELVGSKVEVSRIAGGDLKDVRGKIAEITGLFKKFGQVVGYEAKIKDKLYSGSLKDFYVHREYLEDIQPPTATSVSLREGLSHWQVQRDFWHNQVDGLEAFCFELASVTPRAAIKVVADASNARWEFGVPSPMPGDCAIVNCNASLHGDFWTLSSAIYPARDSVKAPLIEGHWQRVFSWSYKVAKIMEEAGWPWNAQRIEARAVASAMVLQPLVDEVLEECWATKKDLVGSFSLPPGSVEAAFSEVRLPAGTVGLVEPPTDLRPYTLMSISPTAAKDRKYLRQVILHECLHVVAASEGGDPHNDEFHALAELMGLEDKHRD